jgi:hypothetical protein
MIATPESNLFLNKTMKATKRVWASGLPPDSCPVTALDGF